MALDKQVDDNSNQGWEFDPKRITVLNFKIQNLSLSNKMCGLFGMTFSMT